MKLSQVLQQQGSLPPQQVAQLGLDLSRALQDLHSQKQAHGGVQLDNILLQQGEQGEQAQLMAAGSQTSPHPAPEILRGKPADARSDIFDLGCVMLHSLTGTPAFADGQTNKSISLQSQQVQSIPRNLLDIVLHCLHPQPQKRIQDASELAQALSSGADADDRQLRRRRMLPTLIPILVVFLLAWGVFWTLDLVPNSESHDPNSRRLALLVDADELASPLAQSPLQWQVMQLPPSMRSKAQLLRQLRDVLESSDAKDQVLIYIQGKSHSQDGRFSLLATDDGIDLLELRSLLQSSNAGKVMLVLDCEHQGELPNPTPAASKPGHLLIFSGNAPLLPRFIQTVQQPKFHLQELLRETRVLAGNIDHAIPLR